MKNIIKMIVAMFLIIALVLPIHTTALAEITETEETLFYGMTTESVRLCISNYFRERDNVLLGTSEVLSSAVLGIQTDERIHRTTLASNGLSWVGSAITVNEIVLGEYASQVSVTETAEYISGTQIVSETLYHEIEVYLNNDGSLIVASDGYTESISNFISASFVEDNIQTLSATPNNGSALCILEIADSQVGVVEYAYNDTEYNRWYDNVGDGWCIVFISWCSVQADVPLNVIPIGAGPSSLHGWFMEREQFYASQSYNGTVAPQPGDIFFTGPNSWTATHGGFVVSVDDNYIYVIEGNAGPQTDRVYTRKISRTATNLIGYGRPAYPSSEHEFIATDYDSLTHSCSCANCGHFTTESHTFTLSHNTQSHYLACSKCAYTKDYASHFFVQSTVGGPYRCKVCGYVTYGVVVNEVTKEEKL